MTRLMVERLWLWLKETNANWPTASGHLLHSTHSGQEHGEWVLAWNFGFLAQIHDLFRTLKTVIHLIWSGLIRLLDSFLPIFSLREKICLFYSWVSFWVWKGKIDSAPVGCQWRSDPEKERGRRGGVAAREVPQLCKPLQFSLECFSLGLNPHRPPPNRFRLKFLHSARPCAPLLPQRSAHTKGHSKRINTKSMGNSEKSKKKKEKNLLSNII